VCAPSVDIEPSIHGVFDRGILLAWWKFWLAGPTNHHELARKEYNSKRYQKAEPHLQILLRKDPNDEWAKDVLSRLYMNTFRHEKAIPLLRKLAESGPDKVIYLHRLSRSLLSVNQVSESINILEGLVESNEISEEGWDILERALRKINEDPDFENNFWKNLSKSGAIFPQIDIQMIRINIQEGNLNEAAIRIDRITSVGQEVDISSKLRLKLAEVLVQEGTPNTALEIIQTVERSNPERARVMANAKRAMGDTSGALESVIEGFEQGATHGLMFASVRLSWDLGMMEEVVTYANQIISDKPTQRVAHRFRLRALVKIGDVNRIKLAITDSLQSLPDFIDAHRVMIDMAFSEFEDWQLVINHCEEILKLEPTDRRSICHLIHAYIKLKWYDEIVELINSATDLHPNDDEIDLTASHAHWKMQDGRHIERINRMLSRHNLSPIYSIAGDQNISVENIRCDAPLYTSAKQPLVSVIMTVYGRDEFLDVAIDSILNQTYQNIELIIVDDCSPDDAYVYLQKMAEQEPRMNVRQVEKNGGTYCAKNSALSIARGEYIAFMDSDDWTHPQRIEKQILALQGTTYRAVCNSYFRISEFGEIFYKGMGAIRLACISLLADRGVFELLGHFDSMRVGADTEFIERIKAYWGDDAVLHDPKPSMFMLNHSSSLTGGGRFQISWRSITGPRLEHHSSFRAWHKKIRHGGEDPHVEFPLRVRPYEIPKEMQAGGLHWTEDQLLFSQLIINRDERWWKTNEQIWQRNLSEKLAGQKWVSQFGINAPRVLWLGDDLKDIPKLANLPNKVVIKPSKGFSAKNVLCLVGSENILDGSHWNDEKIQKQIHSDKFLKRVKPSWMVEEFLSPEAWREDEIIPRDWKFFCFGGEIALIHAVLRISTIEKEKNIHHYFTPDLRQIKRRICQTRPVPEEPLFFPDCWDEMVLQVKKIGSELDCFMRIDMYATEGGPVFGELTPTPDGGAGFTEWADRYLATFWKGLEGV
jgi:glycosyltransferase involved in cell wall biosynthesis/lipopolysaccharide biosynthesis regulator YciM